MTTAANVKKSDSSHWYYPDGRSCYELPKADGKGMKVPTLADARKLNLLPSVTAILKVLHKEALVNWLIEQAVLAVLTTPRLPGEADDAFTTRVLSTERVQDQESQIARDRGTEIHDGLEDWFSGAEVDPEILPWIAPAAEAISRYGSTVGTEQNLTGPGYAGRTDLIQQGVSCYWLWDYKSTKKLPDPKKGGAWSEHVLQAAAYAHAFAIKSDAVVRTGNVYISSIEPGAFVICEHEDWFKAYHEGFAPLVRHWQWSKGYKPVQ